MKHSGNRYDPSVSTLDEQLGQRVKEVRKGLGWSQADVADLARDQGFRWSQPTIAQIEKGARSLSGVELIVLAFVLEATVAELTAGIELPEDPWEPALRGLKEGVKKWKQLLKKAGFTNGLVTIKVLKAIEIASGREAERAAARKLGIDSKLLAAGAFRLWGHGLTEERNDRVAKRAGSTSVKSRQALRGHVTRDLLKELRDQFDEGGE